MFTPTTVVGDEYGDMAGVAYIGCAVVAHHLTHAPHLVIASFDGNEHPYFGSTKIPPLRTATAMYKSRRRLSTVSSVQLTGKSKKESEGSKCPST